ncbi:MAG TPA: TIGR03118 family protein [Caulobacteraceae bacterium]|nr:TIGR03118 family protein [Caulobacteraceae bacterium]
MKAAAATALALSLMATTALATPRPLSDAQMSEVVAGADFIVINEISDTNTEGANPADPLLVNAWGLSAAPAGGPLWVANNGTGTSTLYDFTSFSKIPLNVTIPGPHGTAGTPTGTVFTNVALDTFAVSKGGVSGHSFFLFDSEDGTISGWAPSVDPTKAIIAVNQSASGAVFKGLAIANTGKADATAKIYAADFAQNRVEIFNSHFHQVGSFTDPALPPGYAPFNVQTLQGKIYVTFALRGHGADEVDGAGLGFVDVFDKQGNKLSTLVAGGLLNAPWGLTIAPKSFGSLAGALLVGNFGDGKINAYDPKTGAFLGTVHSPNGAPVSIDGLWAMRRGPDGTVIFSSGPDDESHGLVGVIRPSWSPASWAFQSHVVLGHR